MSLSNFVRKLMHASEFCILTAFMEVITPIVYSLYLGIISHMPNRNYYTQFATMNLTHLTNTVLNVLLYSLVELSSFIVISQTLKNRLNFSTLRQLAFVLDRQMVHVQTAIILWVFYTTQMSLDHYGTDYTFKFEWLQATVAEYLMIFRHKHTFYSNTRVHLGKVGEGNANSRLKMIGILQVRCRQSCPRDARIYSFFVLGVRNKSSLEIMPMPTPEEEHGCRFHHPREWHDKKHGSDGFCSRMKIVYGCQQDLSWFRWMLAQCDEPLTTAAMDGAASNGQLHNVVWFDKNRFEGCTTAAIDGAASGGHLDVVKWLLENRTEGCTTAAMDGAATNGMYNMVCWLHDNRSEGCTTAAMDGAATNGHLAVVKFLHEKRSEGCTTAAMDGAVTSSRVEVARWLHQNRSEGCTTAAMDNAAGQGYLAAVKWLNENRSEGCSPAAMVNAASKGYLDVVKYLHVNVNQQVTNAAITTASENGHLRIVEYLHEKKSDDCSVGAKGFKQKKKQRHENKAAPNSKLKWRKRFGQIFFKNVSVLYRT